MNLSHHALNAALLLFFGSGFTKSVAAAGYCNYNNCDGATSSSTSTGYCSESEQNCLVDCASTDPNYPAVWCTDGGPTSGPGPSPTPGPGPTTGSSGTASTTRYWDCSGGACACAYVPLGLSNPGDPGEPAHCHSNAMFAAPANNPYGAKFYGTAAVSQALGGGDWLAEACGKCWKVTGTGLDGSVSTLVLRGANYCPPANSACNNNAHFDVAAPGFDVTAFSLANTCSTREADEAEGFAACGNWMIGEQDPTINCDCSKFLSQTLRQGCENFLSLQWDNPQVEYEEVTCPPEMVTPCEYNNGYPDENSGSVPDTCYAPSSSPATPVPPTAEPPTTTPVPPTPMPPTPVPPTQELPSPTPAPPQCTSPTQCNDNNPCTVDKCLGDDTCQEPREDACARDGKVCINQQCVTPTTPSPPTPNPPTPVPPTPSPPTGGGGECCSQTFDKCMDGDWCNQSESSCGNCGGLWMVPSIRCLPRYAECTNDNNCCPPSQCKGGRWYKQCKY